MGAAAPAGPAPGAGGVPRTAAGPLLLFSDVTFRYPEAATAAVHGIDLAIPHGAFVAILGGNGSGKSTLARLMNGLLVPSSGRVLVAGLDTAEPAARLQARRRVGLVFQNPDNQIVASVVEDDVAFGPENLGLPPAEIGRRVREALEALSLSAEARRDPHHLSGGQKQRLAIAGALAMRPDAVCLDEPMSSLDPHGRAEVGAAIADLQAAGHAVVLITHHAEEAASADRVIVLAQGAVVADAPPRSVFADVRRLQAWGVEPPPGAAAQAGLLARGVTVGAPCLTMAELAAALGAPPRRPGPAAAGGEALRPGPPPAGISLRGARYAYPDPAVARRLRTPAVQDLDLRLGPGECVALLGATGSGKSTAALLCCALLQPEAGELAIDGLRPWAQPRRRRGPALRAARRLAGLVFQRPEEQFFEERVLDEVAFGPRNYGAPPAQAAALAGAALRRAGLSEEFEGRSPFALSGGQMRRVAIAAVLAARPRYLLLDEPTAGLDADGRSAVLALVRQLRASGTGILLITHRMEEAAELAERAVLMQGGRIVAEGPLPAIFADAERLTACGLGLPPAAELASALRRRGWNLPPDLLTLDPVLDAIAAAAGGDPPRSRK